MMDKMDIAFPNLGIYLNNVPKSFHVFGFEIALYGIFIALAVLGGILMAAREAKKTGQNEDIYWDMAIYIMLFSIIGARIYYVIFSWDVYKDNLLSIFNLREGGLAIYGGVIAGFATAFIYAKIRKLSFLQLVDTAVLGLIVGQVIGRWGNFTNREVFGGYTNNLLAMRLPIESIRSTADITEGIAAHIVEGTNYIQVHPTFLYESLWNLLLLFLILFYRRHKKFQGEVALLYFAGYGLGRIWIEGIRTDQLWLPGTTIAVSQVLAGVFIVVAVAADVFVRIRLKKKQKAEN